MSNIEVGFRGALVIQVEDCGTQVPPSNMDALLTPPDLVHTIKELPGGSNLGNLNPKNSRLATEACSTQIP